MVATEPDANEDENPAAALTAPVNATLVAAANQLVSSSAAAVPTQTMGPLPSVDADLDRWDAQATTKGFTWERSVDDDEEEKDEDDEEEEDEVLEEELEVGAGIVPDPAWATDATATPKGRVSPPCPPGTVAAPDQPRAPFGGAGLDAGLDSLVAAFAASSSLGGAGSAVDETTSELPAGASSAFASAEASPLPAASEAGNWISDELAAKLMEKEIYEAGCIPLACAPAHRAPIQIISAAP